MDETNVQSLNDLNKGKQFKAAVRAFSPDIRKGIDDGDIEAKVKTTKVEVEIEDEDGNKVKKAAKNDFITLIPQNMDGVMAMLGDEDEVCKLVSRGYLTDARLEARTKALGILEGPKKTLDATKNKFKELVDSINILVTAHGMSPQKAAEVIGMDYELLVKTGMLQAEDDDDSEEDSGKKKKKKKKNKDNADSDPDDPNYD